MSDDCRKIALDDSEALEPLLKRRDCAQDCRIGLAVLVEVTSDAGQQHVKNGAAPRLKLDNLERFLESFNNLSGAHGFRWIVTQEIFDWCRGVTIDGRTIFSEQVDPVARCE